jgi:cyclase
VRRPLLAAVAAAAIAGARLLSAQGSGATAPAVHVEPVQKSVYLLAAAGSGNITVQVGPEGVLMVDSGIDRSAQQVAAAVKTLSAGRVRWLINTHMHPDHVGGNATFGKLAGADGPDALKIVGHNTLLDRLTHPPAGQPRFPEEGLPYDGYGTPSKAIYFNGEAVIVYHEPSAHTDGDSVVMFRGSDVLSTGDIFTPGAYPFIDLERGGSVQGEIAALNHLLDLAVPARTQEGGTLIVPGHGRICDEADLVEFRDMIVIVRDRVRDLIGKGMTLEQVKAARPSRDYDTEYVSSGSFVSADRFVESVYASLKKTR